MNDAELREAIVAAAYLEGDFVLRSGKRSRYYLDKSRFETRPDILAPLGDRIAAAVREHEPEAVRLAAPVLGDRVDQSSSGAGDGDVDGPSVRGRPGPLNEVEPLQPVAHPGGVGRVDAQLLREGADRLGTLGREQHQHPVLRHGDRDRR